MPRADSILRKENRENRPVPIACWVTPQVQSSSVLADYTIGNPQPKANASGFLGREKRLEDPLSVRRRNSAAVVRNGDPHTRNAIDRATPNPNAQPPVIGNRIQRVAHQVGKDLAQLVFEAPKLYIRVALRHHFDLPRQEARAEDVMTDCMVSERSANVAAFDWR